MNTTFVPFTEPWQKTATRTVLLALAIGAAVGWFRHRLALVFPVSLFALWFTLGGHYLEVLFRNHLRLQLPRAALSQLSARLIYWFLGGSAIYAATLTTSQALAPHWPSGARWWLVGLAFLAAELLIHGLMAARGQASIYDGHG